MKASIAATIVAYASMAHGHMLIQKPAPFAGTIKSPLDPSGSNFPCQSPSDYRAGTITSMPAGSQQPLQFNLGGGANTATHGGGSCQVAISYATDEAGLKDPSNWKVLKSFVGGCMTNAPGNLGTAIACAASTDGTNCVDQGFSFEVPGFVPSGDAVFAWTWFNTIGNREMYMNCAPINIPSNSNADQAKFSALPSLFTANIGNGCTTTESTNLDFPDPGSVVEQNPSLNFPLKAPVGSCQAAGSKAAVVPASSAAGAAAATSPAARAGTFAEGAASAPSAVPTTLAIQAVSAAPAAASSAAAAAAAPSSAPVAVASGSCATGQAACSASGFYCIDSQTFGLCANGCAVPMKVAAGTQCSKDAIGFSSRKTKRWSSMRVARGIFGL